jgi:hypothetical protein
MSECRVAPEIWPFTCLVCWAPVELRRGWGIGRIFEREGEAEHRHPTLDPMLPPGIADRFVGGLCGCDLLVAMDGSRTHFATGRPHGCSS